MWPINLSVRLAIVGLVGRYLTNYLMARKPVFKHLSFPLSAMRQCGHMRYYIPFPEIIPLLKVGCLRVTHPFATKR